MTELLSTDDHMDSGQEHRPKVAKGAQDKQGMACQDTSGGGREHQLFAGGGGAGLCTLGQVQGGSGVWARLRRSGSRMEGGDWWMGQLVLGYVQDGVQCGDGPGQCGKTAHMLEGWVQYPVLEGLWPCRCPWASGHLALSFTPRPHHLRRAPARFRPQPLIPGIAAFAANPVPLDRISSQAAGWGWMLRALQEEKTGTAAQRDFFSS